MFKWKTGTEEFLPKYAWKFFNDVAIKFEIPLYTLCETK